MKVRVGIVGATGYTALEAARLLMRHRSAELVAATSRGECGARLADYHPSLQGLTDVVIDAFDPADLASRCDLVLSCLPHAASATTCQVLLEQGVRVIDLSADFRLARLADYEEWYGQHPWPDRLGATVYGLPEFFADEIREADLVANPGCYPTSAILPLGPLLEADLIDPDEIIVDSKSGVSGAGRGPKLSNLYCEANESITAYAVGEHRHQPEIVDLLDRVSGRRPQIVFTPHLTPMDRGILSTIYVRPRAESVGQAVGEVRACWEGRYAGCAFVRPVDGLPSTKHVSGSNFAHLAVRASGPRLVLVSVIDNLGKGAAGAAVQNMNVMFGIEETEGLI